MGLNDALALAGRYLIDCGTLQELKQVISDLRTHSQDSALADLSEQKIASIEARWKA